MSGSVGELRRRAIEGVEAEVRLFGTAVRDGSLIERPGLVASVAPAAPDRSLFNSVYYEDAAVLAGTIDELVAGYERAGVRAWTVWVPDHDRATAGLLESRGHHLDANPRAMALRLEDLGPRPPLPAGIAPSGGVLAEAAALNDIAYGHAGPAFAAALVDEGDPPIAWAFARDGSDPVSCVGGIELDDDLCVTLVATDPAYRGRGIASAVLHGMLGRARDRGIRTASLQASKAGAPIYERLGFRDLGFIEMWEHRLPAPA